MSNDTSNSTWARDTSGEAMDKYYEVLARMDGSRRAQIAFELSDNVRQTAMAGIRERHPDYNHEQVIEAYLRIILSEDLCSEMFGASGVRP